VRKRRRRQAERWRLVLVGRDEGFCRWVCALPSRKIGSFGSSRELGWRREERRGEGAEVSLSFREKEIDERKRSLE